jgi:uncharacterized membrane protein YkvA (DUF1232 family)
MSDVVLSKPLDRAFKTSLHAAARVLRRRLRLLILLHAAGKKLLDHPELITAFKRDVSVLIRMLRAWAAKEYETVPWKSLLLAAAAVLYFVNPVDVIPDMLAVIGFVDDIAVLGVVVRAIHTDLAEFEEWERAATPAATKKAA